MLRFTFLDTHKQYVRFNEEAVDLSRNNAIALLARFFIPDDPRTFFEDYSEETTPFLLLDDDINNFLSLNEDIQKRNRRSLKNQALYDLRKVFSKSKDPGMNIWREEDDVYRLELPEHTDVDVFKVRNCIKSLDTPLWQWGSMSSFINTIKQIYVGSFLDAVSPDERTNASKWVEDVRWTLAATVLSAFDKYVVCLIAEGKYDLALEFVTTQWLYHPVRKFDYADVLWGHFRLMQILCWSGEPQRAKAHFTKNIKRLRNSTGDVTDLSPLDELNRKIRNGSIGQAPNNVHDPRLLEPIDLPCNRLQHSLTPDPNVIPDTEDLEGASSDQSEDVSFYQRAQYLNALKRDIDNFISDKGVAENRASISLLVTSDFDVNRTAQLEENLAYFLKEYQRVLVIGESGAGKSVQLYVLGQELILEAQVQNDAKIPVLLNLSSWDRSYKTFDKWMSEELSHQSMVLSHVVRDWIREQKLILLLDGLDQMDRVNWPSFIDALEDYIRNHDKNLPEIVISTRTAVDEEGQRYLNALEISNKFKKLTLQALTEKQALEFLFSFGERIRKFYDWVELGMRVKPEERTAVLKTVLDLARNPLTLQLMIDLYQKDFVPDNEISLETLYAKYINLNFSEGRAKFGVEVIEERSQIMKTLAWLAKQTQILSKVEFSPNLINQNWLASDLAKGFVNFVLYIIIFAASALTFFSAWRIGVEIGKDPNAWNSDMGNLAGIGIWLPGWAALGGWSWLWRREGYILVNLRWKPREELVIIQKGEIRNAFLSGIICGGTGVLAGGLVGFYTLKIRQMPFLDGGGIAIGVGTIALGISLAILFIGGINYQFIKIQTPHFRIIGWLVAGVTAGLIFSFGVAFVAHVIFQVGDPRFSTLAGAMACGLSLGLGNGLCRTLFSALRSGYDSPDEIVLMEQSIRQSAQNALRVGFYFGTIGGTVAVATVWVVFLSIIFIADANPTQWIFGMPLWIVVGGDILYTFLLAGFLFFGGLDVIEHIIVRYILYLQDYVPKQGFNDLLDLAVQLRFLIKTGNRYQFFHQTFRDHLAKYADKKQ